MADSAVAAAEYFGAPSTPDTYVAFKVTSEVVSMDQTIRQ
jgi:hypothetical protein